MSMLGTLTNNSDNDDAMQYQVMRAHFLWRPARCIFALAHYIALKKPATA